MTHVAYCYASGQIQISETVPSGAIAFARGPQDGLTELLERTARLAHDNKTWLVPGVPEADDHKAVYPPGTTRRTCLKCRQPFASFGPGNRLCGPCRCSNTHEGEYGGIF